jgi:hypothetical protein
LPERAGGHAGAGERRPDGEPRPFNRPTWAQASTSDTAGVADMPLDDTHGGLGPERIGTSAWLTVVSTAGEPSC